MTSERDEDTFSPAATRLDDEDTDQADMNVDALFPRTPVATPVANRTRAHDVDALLRSAPSAPREPPVATTPVAVPVALATPVHKSILKTTALDSGRRASAASPRTTVVPGSPAAKATTSLRFDSVCLVDCVHLQGCEPPPPPPPPLLLPLVWRKKRRRCRRRCKRARICRRCRPTFTNFPRHTKRRRDKRPRPRRPRPRQPHRTPDKSNCTNNSNNERDASSQTKTPTSSRAHRTMRTRMLMMRAMTGQ